MEKHYYKDDEDKETLINELDDSLLIGGTLFLEEDEIKEIVKQYIDIQTG